MTFAQPFKDYEILDRIGAGAMGTVFKARHKRLSRIVALKVLKPSLARDVRYVERLRREARIVAALNHPNLVAGYDLGEEGGYHFFVMEHVEGRSLRELLAEWGILPEDQALDIALQVARALDHAHERSVTHRDIKPANILIDEKGAVKVTDMGLAKGPADATLTRDGATVGTPQYISPEQARNPQDVDIRSDLYSLGATLYHMATGQPPFQGASLAEVIVQVLHESPVSPRVINPNLSEGMSLVIRKLLCKRAALRYQTPRELIGDLERLRSDERPLVDEARLQSAEAPARSAWNLRVAAALAAAALSCAALGYWIGAQARPPVTTAATAAEWEQRLRADLATETMPGPRLLRLQERAASAPAGAGEVVRALQREATAALQQAVGAAMARLQSQRWDEAEQAAHDPQQWPDAEALWRRLCAPLVEQAAGLPVELLPPASVAGETASARAALMDLVARRDEALVARSRRELEQPLGWRADAMLRRGEFAGVRRAWGEGLTTFFDGVRAPRLEGLEASVRRQIEDSYRQREQAGLEAASVAEQRAASSMHEEVRAVLSALVAGLEAPGTAAQGPSLPEVEAALRRLASLPAQFAATYPRSEDFAPAQDPWPQARSSISSLQRRLDLQREAAVRVQLRHAADFAWAVFAQAGPTAALATVADLPEAFEHRAFLVAAAAAEARLMAALRQAPPPFLGFPRNGGAAMELRVGETGELQARAPLGSWRRARLSEFRFDDLWARILSLTGEPTELDETLAVGLCVLGLGCDAPQVLDARVEAANLSFLRQEVWPRLQLGVKEDGAAMGQRALALQRLRQLASPTGQEAPLAELEAAYDGWQRAFAADSSPAEDAVAAAVLQRIERERARRDLLQQVQQNAPLGAVVTVGAEGDALVVRVEAAAFAMRTAGEGWQLSGSTLQFAHRPTDPAAVGRRRLVLEGGLPTATQSLSVACDMAFPNASVGARVYVIEMRGLAFALTVLGDGRFGAARLDGGATDQGALRAALARVVHATLDAGPTPPAALCIPMAFHRVEFELTSTQRARLLVDGVELCDEVVAASSAAAESRLSILPLQDVVVRGALLTARL